MNSQTSKIMEPVGSAEMALTKQVVTRPDRARWGRILRRQPALNLILFAATLVTTTWAGAALAGVSLFRNPEMWTIGLPYAAAVLVILGVHEMGHYLAGRYHRVRVSLPYFIPLPFAIGTLGAFIRMEDEPRERRKMFDIAVAGPLAGLLAAIGVLAVGLLLTSGGGAAPAVDPSSSLILGLLADVLGRDPGALASHPLVFAGWLGLMLTAFNLLPVGQLDGGHMARSLFGERTARWIGRVTLATLVILGLLVWHGLLLWALVAFVFSGASGASAADAADAAHAGGAIDRRRYALAAVAFALIALILVPLPGAGSGLLGSGCPLA